MRCKLSFEIFRVRRDIGYVLVVLPGKSSASGGEENCGVEN
jgi:hypothetical protein